MPVPGRPIAMMPGVLMPVDVMVDINVTINDPVGLSILIKR
jgi:hypothetical protein